MSQSLISRSLDLRRLQSEGYEIEVRSDHLLLNAIPYVTSERKIMRGTLVSDLELAGDATARPSNHVVMFAGEMPCDQEGRPLRQIYHSSTRKELATSLLLIIHSQVSQRKGTATITRKWSPTLTSYLSLHCQLTQTWTSELFQSLRLRMRNLYLSILIRRRAVPESRHIRKTRTWLGCNRWVRGNRILHSRLAGEDTSERDPFVRRGQVWAAQRISLSRRAGT